MIPIKREKILRKLALVARDEWTTLLWTTLGSVLISFAIVALTVSYRFAGGGLAGLALLTKYVWDISPAWLLATGNTLLLALGWRALSPRFVFWTLYVSLMTSGMVAFFELFQYPLLDNTLLAAILAGVVGGLGYGLVLRAGGSSGGTDVLVMVARKKLGVDVGTYSFYLNTAILLCSWFVVDLEQLLMGGVLLYAESLAIDGVMKSFDRRKQAIIITDRPGEVKAFILDVMGKSATLVKGEGAYTGKEKIMIISVMNQRQAMELKRFVASLDPQAFMILADVAEVVGDGFKHWKHI